MTLLQIKAGKKVEKGLGSESLLCIFHGYGADRENLYDIGLAFSQIFPQKLIIIPNAIQRFEAGGGGYQWFSLRDYREEAMAEELSKVGPLVASWIQKRLNENALDQKELELVGFSQGSMLALYLAAANLVKPKKIISYSGLFIPPKILNSEKKNTQLLALHGSEDPVLTLSMAENSYKKLVNFGLEQKLIVEKGLGHYINDRGIKSGIDFLNL
jgi:phospholipase/carboxylesterase